MLPNKNRDTLTVWSQILKYLTSNGRTCRYTLRQVVGDECNSKAFSKAMCKLLQNDLIRECDRSKTMVYPTGKGYDTKLQTRRKSLNLKRKQSKSILSGDGGFVRNALKSTPNSVWQLAKK